MFVSVFLFLTRYLQALRVGDALFRGSILGLYSYLGTRLYTNWPEIIENLGTQLKGVTYPALVYFAFYGTILMMVLSILITAAGLRRQTAGLNRRALGGGLYVTKVALMTLVNTAVLLVRVGMSAFIPGNALQTCVDAVTHYLERQADAIIKPMR